MTAPSETDKPAAEHGGLKNKKTRHLDAVAQQMKFSAILKILLNELHGIPASCEIANEDLRPFFMRWLEMELEVLHKMSDYGITAEDSDDEQDEQPDNLSGQTTWYWCPSGFGSPPGTNLLADLDPVLTGLSESKKTQETRSTSS